MIQTRGLALPTVGGLLTGDPAEPIGDEVLAQRARDGHQAAFAELVRRHQSRVRGLLLRLSADTSLADDLAQEAFLRAYRGLVGFEGRSRFSTWIYRIAYNVYLNHRSRSRGHASLPVGFDGRADTEPGNDPTASDLRRDIAEALAELPPRYRAVIVLYYLQGTSYPEIAEILELPLGTVKTHLHRGKRLLRARLHGFDPPELGDECGEVEDV